MQAINSWLHDVFLTPSVLETVVWLTLVSAVGILLGKLRVGKISLGITFVFFVGILASHFGVRVHPEMNSFAQTLGLALFVYALGVEVGPSFFPSLKSQGILYNVLGLAVIGIGLAVVVALHYIFGISMPNMLGIMAGAVTNTPMLAAVQSTMQDVLGSDGTRQIADLALGCALTYPLGVVGMILAIITLNILDPKRHKRNEEDKSRNTYITELELTNPTLFGKTILEAVRLEEKHFIISRIWRGEGLIIPSSQTVLHEGDHLLVLVHPEDVDEMERFFGRRAESRDWNRPDIDWDAIDSQLISKRIIITNSKVNGAKLGALRRAISTASTSRASTVLVSRSLPPPTCTCSSETACRSWAKHRRSSVPQSSSGTQSTCWTSPSSSASSSVWRWAVSLAPSPWPSQGSACRSSSVWLVARSSWGS